MNRTRVLIVAVLSAAALLVVATLVWRTIGGESVNPGFAAGPPGGTNSGEQPRRWGRGSGPRRKSSWRLTPEREARRLKSK